MAWFYSARWPEIGPPYTIVRSAVRNWPGHNLFLQLHGVVGLERPITEDDRRQLRNAHVNALVEVDGKVFTGRGGMSSAGTSMHATMKADRLRRLLDALQADEDAIVAHMREQPDNIGRRVPARPEFEVIEAQSQHGYGFALREKKSGATLWLG